MNAPTQDEVEALIETGELRIAGRYTWTSSGAYSKTKIPVSCNTSDRLTLHFNANRLIPGKASVVLLLSGRYRIRSLDLAGSHSNKHTDDSRWVEQSHFHIWTDRCSDRYAVDFEGEEPEGVQDILVEFCRAVGIACEAVVDELPIVQAALDFGDV